MMAHHYEYGIRKEFRERREVDSRGTCRYETMIAEEYDDINSAKYH
jgi:hypothetical protein